MNSRSSVVNLSGDFEETIQRWALDLGPDDTSTRWKVFQEIYGRERKPKSKRQIADKLGLSGSQSQVVQDALEYLKNHHLIERFENDGSVRDGSRWLYRKDPSVQAHREKIMRLARNPARAKKMVTKRQPKLAPDAGLSFIKVTRSRKTRQVAKAVSKRDAKLRVAFLVSNPDDQTKLRTDVELKAVSRAIALSGNREKVDLRAYVAASFTDLLDALNEFQPHVIHFSGHGGGGGLSFEAEDFRHGTTHLDFTLIAKVLGAVEPTPKLLIFNACDTVSEAAVLLENVDAVVAMSDSIMDESALLFAPRFYAALVAGQSAQSALIQAKAVLASAGLPDAVLPKLLVASGKSGADIKFL